jgi:hypothetical protein
MVDEMLAPAKLAIFVVMYPIFNLILVSDPPLSVYANCLCTLSPMRVACIC